MRNENKSGEGERHKVYFMSRFASSKFGRSTPSSCSRPACGETFTRARKTRYKDGGESYHEGDSPDARMTAAAAKRGITLEGGSRPLKAKDLEEFDLIVGMVSGLMSFYIVRLHGEVHEFV